MKRYSADILSEITGLSLVGAVLDVLVTGTQTRIELYATDDDTGATVAQPVPNGTAFYVPDGRYDLRARIGARTRIIPSVDMFDGFEQNRRLEAVENGEPGAPGSLRADLLGNSGASIVRMVQAVPGAVNQDLASVTGDLGLTAGATGVVGNGVADDRQALGYGFAAAKTAARPLRVRGTMVTSGPVALPSGLHLRGENAAGTSIAAPLNQSILVNDTSDTGADGSTRSRFVRLSDIGLVGGKRALDLSVTGEQAEYTLSFVGFDKSTEADIYCNRMFIANTFYSTVFNGWKDNVYVADANANLNVFYSVQWKELGGVALTFRGGSEANLICGGRFESRRGFSGNSGLPVIRIENAKAFHVTTSYFEGVHRLILKETGAQGQAWFTHSRFSGQEDAADVPERFESDGAVGMWNNEFFRGSYGAEQMMLVGRNKGLDSRKSWVWRHYEPDHVELSSPQIAFVKDDDVYSLWRFELPNPSGASDHIAAFFGQASFDCTGRLSDGRIWASTALRDLSVVAHPDVANGSLTMNEVAVRQKNHTAVAPIFAIENASVGMDTSGVAYLVLRARVSGLAGLTSGSLKATLTGRFMNAIGRPQLVLKPVLTSGPWT